MVSIWHFQTDDKEGYPKAVRVPANPRGEIADRAFPRSTFDPACRSGNWHPTYRNCGLAELPAIADCQASNFGRQSGGRDFHGVLCAASGRCTRVCPLWTKGVCRVLFSRQRWGQARNRRQQRPGTRRTAWQICFRELSHACNHHL